MGTNYTVDSGGNITALGTAAIGSSGTIDASAQLDIQSTTKGILPPRMTTTQKNAISSPATGLSVYDTSLNVNSTWNGTSWTTSTNTPIPSLQIAYGNPSGTDITSSPNLIFDGANLRALSTAGTTVLNSMTTIQRSALLIPTTGSQVFDNVFETPMWYNGTNWAPLFIANSYVPTITSTNAAIASGSNVFSYYMIMGNMVTVNCSISLTLSATPLSGTVTTPIFTVSVPQQISSLLSGPASSYFAGNGVPIFNQGLNLGHVGDLFFGTATLPAFQLVVYINGQNNAVLIPANNPFQCNFQLSYFANVNI